MTQSELIATEFGQDAVVVGVEESAEATAGAASVIGCPHSAPRASLGLWASVLLGSVELSMA